jgi:hypothetical protein
VNELSTWLPDSVGVAPLLVAALVTFLSACVQGTLGFGFAVVSVPLLSLLHPALAPVPQLLLALPLTLSMAVRERHAIDLRGVGFVVSGRIVGLALGVALVAMARVDSAVRALESARGVARVQEIPEKAGIVPGTAVAIAGRRAGRA